MGPEQMDQQTSFGMSGREAGIKFAFFAVGLSFSLLALATQSAEFGKSALIDWVEFIGWILLLLSGLIGLVRLDFIPKSFFDLARPEAQRKRKGKWSYARIILWLHYGNLLLMVIGILLIFVARSAPLFITTQH